MPPAPTHPAARPRRRDRRSLLVATLTVALGVAVFVGVVFYVSDNDDVKSNLVEDDFSAGRTDRLAAEIADRGPFLLPDASGRSRDVYLQHLSDDDDTGWLAFSARAPGQDDRRCSLVWDPAEEQFTDPCSGDTFPADGAGLTQFRTSVRDGNLYVDLRRTTDPAEDGG